MILNVDMTLDDQTEDLSVDRYGSINYYSFDDTPPNAVIRRLGTPPEGYARMIRVGSEALVYDSNYFSQLPLLLSTPGLDAGEVQSVVELASNQDGRVNTIDFAVNEQSGSVHSFTLSYLTADDNIQSITASL